MTMYSADKTIGIKILGLGTAMAGALLAGCSSNPSPIAHVAAGDAENALAQGRHDQAIEHAEAAVLAEPRNGEYRSVLGRAYLDAGRFASAQTAYDDAMVLGDNSPRTALSLALALTAQAKYTEAAALLSDWEGEIAPADLGLAFSLAGQPERGIHIMTNAIRGGRNTVKMRQNLAYAYAVAGRWREARIMVSQDVPAGEVGGRMEQWAVMVEPTAYQLRVARLLDVPSGVRDEGLPYLLALSNHPEAAPMMALAPADAAPAIEAEETPAVQVAQVETPAPMAIPVTSGELPSVGRPANVVAAGDNAETGAAFAQSFTPEPAPAAAAPRVAHDAIVFVSRPVVQHIPGVDTETANSETAIAPVAAQSAQAAVAAPVATAPVATAPVATAPGANGDHLVQLGSFSSEASAERAWQIYVSRYPELANHDMIITQAVVQGRNYWRVSAGGFDRADSRSMCASSNANAGEGCISWAANSPLPGAVNSRAASDTMLASR